MGMFDSVYVVSCSDALMPRCAAGHLMRGELQTKDLDCNMDTYYVFDGALYLSPGGLSQVLAREPPRYVAADRHLRIEHTELANLYPKDAIIHAYDDCEQCLPVLMHARGGWAGDIAEHHPWCEYRMTFKDGRLVSCENVKVETRDEIRARYVEAIPDTDHIAKRHFELRAQRKAR